MTVVAPPGGARAEHNAAAARPELRRRSRWFAPAAGAAVAGGTAYLFTHDPHEAGAYPPCVLLSLTGLYCPACGGTRAAYDLLHGDVAGSFARNPLVPLLAIIAVLWLGRRVVRALRTRRGQVLRAGRPWPNWVPVALGVAFVAFGVLRNVPGWTWLSPL